MLCWVYSNYSEMCNLVRKIHTAIVRGDKLNFRVWYSKRFENIFYPGWMTYEMGDWSMFISR